MWPFRMPAELLMLNVTFDFCPQSTILSCSEQFDGRLLIFFASFQAGKTLSARKWHAAFSPDGCLDIASVLSRIQRGVRFLIFWSYCFSVSYMLLVLQMSNYILSVMFTPINMIYLLLGCASNSQGAGLGILTWLFRSQKYLWWEGRDQANTQVFTSLEEYVGHFLFDKPFFLLFSLRNL